MYSYTLYTARKEVLWSLYFTSLVGYEHLEPMRVWNGRVYESVYEGVGREGV